MKQRNIYLKINLITQVYILLIYILSIWMKQWIKPGLTRVFFSVFSKKIIYFPLFSCSHLLFLYFLSMEIESFLTEAQSKSLSSSMRQIAVTIRIAPVSQFTRRKGCFCFKTPAGYSVFIWPLKFWTLIEAGIAGESTWKSPFLERKEREEGAGIGWSRRGPLPIVLTFFHWTSSSS